MSAWEITGWVLFAIWVVGTLFWLILCLLDTGMDRDAIVPVLIFWPLLMVILGWFAISEYFKRRRVPTPPKVST